MYQVIPIAMAASVKVLASMISNFFCFDRVGGKYRLDNNGTRAMGIRLNQGTSL